MNIPPRLGECSAVIFQPTYWPDLHYLHRMARANVIVVLDQAQFRRQWHDHHRTTLPSGFLSVPIRHDGEGQRRTFRDITTEFDGWQSRHIAQLAKWYPTAHFNLSLAYQAIAEFGADFCEGIRRTYEVVLQWLPDTHPRTIVWQSDLKDDPNLVGVKQLAYLCKQVGANTYLLGRGAYEGYVEHGAVLRGADILPLIQELTFAPYGPYSNFQAHSFAFDPDRARENNWSCLDLMAKLGRTDVRDYLRDIENIGWETA